MRSKDKSPNDGKNTDINKGKLTASSNATDNFAMVLKPPAKKAKPQCDTIVIEKEMAAPCKRQTIIPFKRNKRVIKSDSDDDDDDDDDDAFLASCKK